MKVIWRESTPDDPIYREGPQVFIPCPRPAPRPVEPKQQRDDRRDDGEEAQ